MAGHPKDYLSHILAALRDADLGWIADEIDAEFSAGRMIEKTVEGRQKSGLTVEEFTEDERLGIAMRIVLERTQVAYAVWLETRDLLHQRVDLQAVKYVEVTGENSSTFEPFTTDFETAADELAVVFGRVAAECGLFGSEDVHRLTARPSRLKWGDE